MQLRDNQSVKNSLTDYKSLNISLNSIENDKIGRKRQRKSLEKVRKRRKEKKPRSYYPVRDAESETGVSGPPDGKLNGNSTRDELKPIDSFTESVHDTNRSSETETISSLKNRMEKFIPIKLNLEYVDLNRDKTRNNSLTDDVLAEPGDEPAGSRIDDFSRKLPSNRQSSVRGLDNISAGRTSSRTLFPTERRTYSVYSPTTSSASKRTTPSPTSYFNAKTPEFNHVSFLTHPSQLSTKSSVTTTVRDNNRKSFDSGDFQTNFAQQIINAVDDIIVGSQDEKTDTRNSRIPKNGFHSFFKMGSPLPASTTTRKPTTLKPKTKLFEEKDFQVSTWGRDAFHTEVK